MMPRPSPDNQDGYAAQSYGRSRTVQQPYAGAQGFGADPLRHRISEQQQQQQNLAMQQMQMQQMHHMAQMNMQMDQSLMMQNQMGYGGGRASPILNPMQYNMNVDVSPNVAAQRMGVYNAMTPSQQTPNSPAAFQEMDSRGMVTHQGTAGPSGALSQAEREEELLLNLLIARRQRGRVADVKGGANPSLAEELMRMRQQSRVPQHGRSAGLPPVPGMPPLFGDNTAVSGHYQGISFDSRMATDAMNLSTTMQQDVQERIDRSPTRLIDARSQEMLDYSGRGMKRGHQQFDNAQLKFQQAMRMQEMELSPAKKKRKHKKKPADMPRRPLSAYNLFFSEERERILSEIDGKDGDGESNKDDSSAAKDSSKDEEGVSPKPKALLRPLIPSQKKRRPHRKTHGKISFQELARMVGERWKNLSDEKRQYYQDLAKEDMKRQKAAMEEYYAKQNADKPELKNEAEVDV